MELTLIRHFPTQGNLQKKYIGRTDEPLLEDYLMDNIWKYRGLYVPSQRLVASPMLRCMQTAKVLFPGQKIAACDSLKETDFGIFEGKSYDELEDVPEYQKWLDSNGQGEIPEGESKADFKARCIQGLEELVVSFAEEKVESATVVVHGGTIMALMEAFAEEKKDFYHWQLSNGCGYKFQIDLDRWMSGDKLFTNIVKLEAKDSKVTI